jgi:hypothetical protein
MDDSTLALLSADANRARTFPHCGWCARTRHDRIKDATMGLAEPDTTLARTQPLAPGTHQSLVVQGDGNIVIVGGRDLVVTAPVTVADGLPAAEIRTPGQGRTRDPGTRRPLRRRPSLHGRMHQRVAGALLSVFALAAPLSLPFRLPSVVTAQCRDGSPSPSRHRAGTCSGHGGVAEWLYPASHPIWNDPVAARSRAVRPPGDDGLTVSQNTM